VKILKFLDQKNRESVPPFKRALRLFMVRDVAGGCHCHLFSSSFSGG
jgi:hypothetical protein